MFGIGMPELIVVLAIVMIVFGANKIPQMMEGMGKGIRSFKKGIKEEEEIRNVSETGSGRIPQNNKLPKSGPES